MVSSGKKVAHFFRGYAVTPFKTRDSSCFGRFWNCMDFAGDSTWCFFCAESLKKNNYSINNLFQVFFWRNGVHFRFPMFLPTGVQALVFFKFECSYFERPYTADSAMERLIPFGEIALKQAT